METKVLDVVVLTLPGGPEMVGVLRTSLLHSTLPSGPMHPYRAGAQPAMARRGDTGVWKRNSRQPF